MEDYKSRFIEYLLTTQALKGNGDFSLKSKRLSPWFVNIGDFNDGHSLRELGRFYAYSILGATANSKIDILYGIPEKGNMLVAATSIGLAERGENVPCFFTRKVPKEYGEATNLAPAERIKALVVGRAPINGQSIIQLDDVFTAGDAKYEARATLESLGNFDLPVLAIAVDRQEVGIDGKSAIEEYERKTGTRVSSIVSASDIYQYMKEHPDAPFNLERMTNYMRVYGTDAARRTVGKLEQKVIEIDRSIIPACDVATMDQFEEIAKQTADIEKIGALKVGFELGLTYGLPLVVQMAREHTNKLIIYDHQKAGTDITDTGKNFARVCKKAGVDGVIFFPQSGPETERAWIYHALDQGLKVIVGGWMTHPAYSVSEGGFVADEGILEMFRIAARIGVNDFVVPGNKLEAIKKIKDVVEAEGSTPVFYAPGFVAQGGNISEAAKVVGSRFHGIVGRAITECGNVRQAALEYTSQL